MTPDEKIGLAATLGAIVVGALGVLNWLAYQARPKVLRP